ncbi:MAG TPA: hypothetical protein VGF49_05950 [Candidatus Solibacter sp.]
MIWATIGAAMVAAGSRRRTLWDAACGIGGAGMLVYAVAARPAAEKYIRDMVDVASEDSFPASDPPSSW